MSNHSAAQFHPESCGGSLNHCCACEVEGETERANILMDLARMVNDWCLGTCTADELRAANGRCADRLHEAKARRYAAR